MFRKVAYTAIAATAALAALWATAPTIMASPTNEPLPSMVFVLDTNTVVTRLPADRQCTNHQDVNQAVASNTVSVTSTIAPSRMVVVNENDEIVSIYSNTAKTDCSFYTLTIREISTGQGPSPDSEHPHGVQSTGRQHRLEHRREGLLGHVTVDSETCIEAEIPPNPPFAKGGTRPRPSRSKRINHPDLVFVQGPAAAFPC